ncbi:YopX family protein [Clostridium perfringens]|uniref:YopX family protein n=1 Tax=Clostridium perfringens TaxID=1502 RepID=UPI00224533C6|nr:YopX family protein [Clostridium perfringens]MCX0386700.1 YopX family protein [Clostridium perfringens]
MIRELKFRVWDKTSDSMLYQDDFERVELDTKNKMVTLIAEEESDKSHYVLDYEDGIEAEILQYTGLKDKDGQDIYEGDILINTNKSKLNLGMDNQKYLVVYKTLGFYLKPLFKGIALKFDYSDLKKLGNIYENPELLEGER